MDNNNNNESREHYRKRMEERIQRDVNERKRREREEAHNKRENRLRREEEQSSPDYQPPKKHHYRTPNWVRALIGLLICLVVAGGFYEYQKFTQLPRECLVLVMVRLVRSCKKVSLFLFLRWEPMLVP